MRRVKKVIATISLLGLIFLAVPASAQTSTALSGGDASDYQPPTGNPQNNTTTGLQTTGSGLQPVPGQNNFSQENLGGTDDLQVAGVTADEPNTNTTSTEATDVRPGINPLPLLLVGLLTLGGIVYVLVQPTGNSRRSVPPKTDAPAKLVPESLPSSKKPKKKLSKKKAVAKKSAHRTGRRKK